MDSRRPSELELRRLDTTLSGKTLADDRRSSRGGDLGARNNKSFVLETPLLQPSRPRLLQEVMTTTANFSESTSIDVLEVSAGHAEWTSQADDDVIDKILQRLPTTKANTQPTLLLFIVNLEAEKLATYGHRATVSYSFVHKMISNFNVHETFVLDLFGRPDYWSAVGLPKLDEGCLLGSAYEFWCQHPRWLANKRWDKKQHRAPCSVYMHHSDQRDLTIYLMSAAKDDSCVTLLQKNLGYEVEPGEHTASLNLAAESPFYLHAMVNGIAFEQSQDYVADVRTRLMTEIIKVNDFSRAEVNDSIESKLQNLDSRSKEGRAQLEKINKALHLVSQTADSGIANADMSIRLSEELISAQAQFACKKPSPAMPAPVDYRTLALQQTTSSLDFLLKSWHTQKNWLISYKARKDTAMNFVFNAVMQQDSATNVDIGTKMARDSSSMHTITILTMVFLPGTFIAGIFSSGIITSSASANFHLSALFVPFLCLVMLLTSTTVAVWLGRRKLRALLGMVRTRKMSMQRSGTKLGRDVEKGS